MTVEDILVLHLLLVKTNEINDISDIEHVNPDLPTSRHSNLPKAINAVASVTS